MCPWCFFVRFLGRNPRDPLRGASNLRCDMIQVCVEKWTKSGGGERNTSNKQIRTETGETWCCLTEEVRAWTSRMNTGTRAQITAACIKGCADGTWVHDNRNAAAGTSSSSNNLAMGSNHKTQGRRKTAQERFLWMAFAAESDGLREGQNTISLPVSLSVFIAHLEVCVRERACSCKCESAQHTKHQAKSGHSFRG